MSIVNMMLCNHQARLSLSIDILSSSYFRSTPLIAISPKAMNVRVTSSSFIGHKPKGSMQTVQQSCKPCPHFIRCQSLVSSGNRDEAQCDRM